MENHMCILLVRYVDLIMQCTKHFYNQIMVYYGDIKLQSYKTLLPQVSMTSDRAPEKYNCMHCIGRMH